MHDKNPAKAGFLRFGRYFAAPSSIAPQARGYNDADIRKILGRNLLRAWGAIEDGAAK